MKFRPKMLIPVLAIAVVAMFVYWDKKKEEATIRENIEHFRRTYTAFLSRDPPDTSVLQPPDTSVLQRPVRQRRVAGWHEPNFLDTTWDPVFVDAEEFITVDADNWNRLATAGAGSVNDGVTPQSLV